MSKLTAAIHCHSGIAWQVHYSVAIENGLRSKGYEVARTGQRCDTGSDIEILLGCNQWRSVQDEMAANKRPYIMVNRAFWGDPDWVAIGWNGVNGYAVFAEPQPITYDSPRWMHRWQNYGPQHLLQTPRDPQETGKAILFGQAALHSEEYRSLQHWYTCVVEQVAKRLPGLTLHYRPHPAVGDDSGLGLPLAAGDLDKELQDCVLAVTLNSTVCVESLLRGIPTVCMDAGSPGHPVAGQHIGEVCYWPHRMPWLHRLAWAQWSHRELQVGLPWAPLLAVAPETYGYRVWPALPT